MQFVEKLKGDAMTTRYIQLTDNERYHIYTMKRSGFSNSSIAKSMGRHHTTIGRELKRNTGLNGYRFKQAHQKAQQRHQMKTKSIKLTKSIQDFIIKKLKIDWSPEIICAILKMEQGISIHHESVYRFIYADKAKGGNLYRHLSHASKKNRKRYGKNDYRGRIPNRIDIEERPSIVDKKSRLGDWEADTVIGKGHKGAIVTLAERRSRLYLAMPIARKTAELTSAAVITLLATFRDYVHTITYDNGREFSAHNIIAEKLDCKGYFARPYHSWERGLNEQSNGLLRRYFPKGMALDKVTTTEVFNAVDKINNRPRKCLGYKTPWQVFLELTQDKLIFSNQCALMS